MPDTLVICPEVLNPQAAIINPQSRAATIEQINTLHHEATYLAELARDVGAAATRKAILLGLKLAALKDATPHGQWESLFASGQRRVPGVSPRSETFSQVH